MTNLRVDGRISSHKLNRPRPGGIGAGLIDLSSDTSTMPDPGMYEAMCGAELGDEQKGMDPTVNALCGRVAEMLGKERGVFLPSGVMCNLVAILAQCDRGDEVLASSASHILNMEAGAPAAVAGVTIRPLDGPNGIYDAESVKRAIRRSTKRNVSATSLIAIEQTCNRGGGSIWPLAGITEIRHIAQHHGVPMHMDGARLLNACVATGVSPREFAAPFNSAWIDLSKGLGCPIGAVLAGSAELIEKAWIWKQRLGGAMRQAGVLAAAGLYALERYEQQLAIDHDNARQLAEALEKLPGVRLKWPPQTNMVYFDVSDTGTGAAEIVEGLMKNAVSMGVESEHELRAVTHVGITSADVDTAAYTLRMVLAAL